MIRARATGVLSVLLVTFCLVCILSTVAASSVEAQRTLSASDLQDDLLLHRNRGSVSVQLAEDSEDDDDAEDSDETAKLANRADHLIKKADSMDKQEDEGMSESEGSSENAEEYTSFGQESSETGVAAEDSELARAIKEAPSPPPFTISDLQNNNVLKAADFEEDEDQSAPQSEDTDDDGALSDGIILKRFSEDTAVSAKGDELEDADDHGGHSDGQLEVEDNRRLSSNSRADASSSDSVSSGPTPLSAKPDAAATINLSPASAPISAASTTSTMKAASVASSASKLQASASTKPSSTSGNAAADLLTKPFEEIVKSKSDDRRYRRFRMETGLDVIVVSDLTSTKSAAAMDINVGYWSDPEDCPGLAHFLEHMLFLGTKKFPEEDAYSSFLGSHGGSSNAFTSMQNTNYYFDVQPAALYGALDRFSQFFIAPLLTESATDREVKAVEAEHMKNLNSDAWRTFMLIQTQARADHPFHKFGTGSSKTLGTIDKTLLRQYLLKFYAQHYIAKNMRLAVIGRHSLSTLEKWVRIIFADIPIGKHTPPVKPAGYPLNDTHTQVFPSEFLPSQIRLRSVKDIKQLLLLFTISPQTPKYYTKSLEYVSTLLGSESKGSLLAALKRRGWANALSAGPDLSTGGFDLFQVDIDLTRKGMKPENIREIIAMVFAQIHLIATSGVEEWRWHEMGTIAATHFRLLSKQATMSYASSLANDMAKYAPRDHLMGAYMYMEFDPNNIHNILKNLVPHRMLFLISSQKDKLEDLPLTEQWYGTRYAISKPSDADLSYWKEARTKGLKLDKPLKLSLPPKNPFIPRSLVIKDKSGPKRHVEHPKIIKDVVDSTSAKTGSIRVWFKQDHAFKRPRANVVCKFWSNTLYATPRDVVFSSLYTKLVRDNLNELAYPASIAGFQFSFSSDVDGLDLHVAGYDSGLKAFTREVARYLTMNLPSNDSSTITTKGFVPDQARFNVIKEELANSYHNFMYGQPHVHAAYSMSLLLEDPHWHISEYVNALRDMELTDIIQWSHNMWKDVALECLAHGNIRKAEALEIVDSITSNVEFRSNHAAQRTMSGQAQRVAELDGAYTFTMKTPNKNEQNSALYQYYQAGVGNFFEDTSTQILSMVMDKPAFHQLRTVEQLGYIVWSGTDIREGINGVRVIVQSPTRSAKYLDGRVRNFIKKLRGEVRKMTARKFRTYVRTLMGVKLQLPRTMAEETAKYWYEISTQQYQFDRKIRELIALRFQTRKKFFQYVDRLFGWRRVPSMISMQIQGSKAPSPRGKKIRYSPKKSKRTAAKKKAKSVRGDIRDKADKSPLSGVPEEALPKKKKDIKAAKRPVTHHSHETAVTSRFRSLRDQTLAHAHVHEVLPASSNSPALSRSRSRWSNDDRLRIETLPSPPIPELAFDGPLPSGLIEITSAEHNEKEIVRCLGVAYDDPRCRCVDATHRSKDDNCNSWQVSRASNKDWLVLHARPASWVTDPHSSDSSTHKELTHENKRLKRVLKKVLAAHNAAKRAVDLRDSVLKARRRRAHRHAARRRQHAARRRSHTRKHSRLSRRQARQLKRHQLAVRKAQRKLRLKKKHSRRGKHHAAPIPVLEAPSLSKIILVKVPEQLPVPVLKPVKTPRKSALKPKASASIEVKFDEVEPVPRFPPQKKHVPAVKPKAPKARIVYRDVVHYKTKVKTEVDLKTKHHFVHWVTEVPCSRSGPRRWHRPTDLTVESLTTFKSTLCLFPRRPVGAVLLPSSAIVSNGKKTNASGLSAAKESRGQASQISSPPSSSPKNMMAAPKKQDQNLLSV